MLTDRLNFKSILLGILCAFCLSACDDNSAQAAKAQQASIKSNAAVKFPAAKASGDAISAEATEASGEVGANPYDFKLQGQDKSYSLKDFKGQNLVIYFGYTLCADVCPTSLSIAASALKELNAKNTKLIFISLDPKRDEPADSTEYVKYFYPNSIALIPSESELKRLSKVYGVKYEYVYQDSAANYTVAHSSSFYLIDKNSQFKGEVSNLAYSNVLKKFKKFLNQN